MEDSSSSSASSSGIPGVSFGVFLGVAEGSFGEVLGVVELAWAESCLLAVLGLVHDSGSGDMFIGWTVFAGRSCL